MNRGFTERIDSAEQKLVVLLMNKQSKSASEKNDLKRSRRENNSTIICLCTISLDDKNITWKGKDLQNRDPYLKSNFIMSIRKCLKKWGWG